MCLSAVRTGEAVLAMAWGFYRGWNLSTNTFFVILRLGRRRYHWHPTPRALKFLRFLPQVFGYFPEDEPGRRTIKNYTPWVWR